MFKCRYLASLKLVERFPTRNLTFPW